MREREGEERETKTVTLCMCVPTCDGYTNTYNEREVLFDSYAAALSPQVVCSFNSA